MPACKVLLPVVAERSKQSDRFLFSFFCSILCRYVVSAFYIVASKVVLGLKSDFVGFFLLHLGNFGLKFGCLELEVVLVVCGPRVSELIVNYFLR